LATYRTWWQFIYLIEKQKLYRRSFNRHVIPVGPPVHFIMWNTRLVQSARLRYIPVAVYVTPAFSLSNSSWNAIPGWRCPHSEGSRIPKNFGLQIHSRDVREWLSTFPFPPIPIFSIPIPSHPIPIFYLFPFPWDSRVGYSHSFPFPFCQC